MNKIVNEDSSASVNRFMAGLLVKAGYDPVIGESDEVAARCVHHRGNAFARCPTETFVKYACLRLSLPKINIQLTP